MAISDKDFYASHGISYDIEEMQIEYTKRVIRQAKIEVLMEIQQEIEEMDSREHECNFATPWCIDRDVVIEIIQEKIKENADATN
jgi:hypothetical protein